MPTRVWVSIGAEALIFAILLFGAAGTLWWPAGWAFMILLFGAVFLITRAMARNDPALLEERMKPFIQKDQPLWDQVIMATMAVLFVGWLVLIGFDAVRFGWSTVPMWLQAVGGAGIAVGMLICHRVFRENTFAVPVVSIQAGRHHRVVSTGPYAVVRHPLYAGALVIFPSAALLLGSWWGLAATTVLSAGIVIRTAMEDRELHHKLDGYPDYAARIHYRLFPFIW
jgi:protein-S-isoprenylcysteine O-methyltransferase Ste14